jgi:asparagine synthase (glutamine-hydrolysing)
MWALAIFDTVTRETVLCRDRFGVKPLYYLASPQRLVFASEVQAIDRLLRGQLTPNPDFLRGSLAFDVSVYAQEETHLKEVRQVQPGYLLLVRPGGRVESRQWYWLRQREVPGPFARQAAELKELAKDACRLRLRSDVPVATCLSGGIDSGSIASLLSEMPAGGDGRFAGFSHQSFNAAFPGTELDEAAAVRELAAVRQLKVDIKTIECPGPAELEEALAACDGPMPAMAFYPIWKLYQHIRRQGIVVTLDGQGADEMLGGYYLGFEALRGAWQARRPWWFRDLYRTYRALQPEAPGRIRDDFNSVVRLAKAELDQACKRPVKELLAAIGLYQAKASKLPRPAPLPSWVPRDHPMRENALALALWRQFFVKPLPFLLHQYDRCSMASGVECRMPFMDYRIVEFVFSLPLASRIGGGFTKRVLREAVRGTLPDSIRLNRLKTGFNAPFSHWLNGPLKEWVLEIANASVFLQNPYFDGHALSSLLGNALQGKGGTLDECQFWPALHAAWWLQHRQPSNRVD